MALAKYPDLAKGLKGERRPRKHYTPEQHGAVARYLRSWWASQKEFRNKNQLAKATGIRPVSLSLYFRAIQFPTGDRFERLSRVVSGLSRFAPSGKPFPAWASEIEAKGRAYTELLAGGDSGKKRRYFRQIVGQLVDAGVSSAAEITPATLVLHPPAYSSRYMHAALHFFGRFLVHEGLWTREHARELRSLLASQELGDARAARWAAYVNSPPDGNLPPGRQLRLWIDAQPWYSSAAAFARSLDVCAGSVFRWLAGRHFPKGELLLKVYEATKLECFNPAVRAKLAGKPRPEGQKASDQKIFSLLGSKLPIRERARRAGLSVSRFYARIGALKWNGSEYRLQQKAVTRYLVDLRRWVRGCKTTPPVDQILERHVKELRGNATDLFRDFNPFMPSLEVELRERPRFIADLLSSPLFVVGSKVLERFRATAKRDPKRPRTRDDDARRAEDLRAKHPELSWGQIARQVDPKGFSKKQKATTDAIRLAVKYYRKLEDRQPEQ